MKSYSMHAAPGHAMLELREAPVPGPGTRQVLLRMRAASLNRGEFILGHRALHAKRLTLFRGSLA